MADLALLVGAWCLRGRLHHHWFHGLLPVPARKGRAADSRGRQPTVPRRARTAAVYARCRQRIQKPDLDRQVARATAWAHDQADRDRFARCVTKVGSALTGTAGFLRCCMTHR